MKIVSGHQPAYLPWMGLFHKLSLCDIFVYMDTVQYLHKDWNNRNKIRSPHGWIWLTVPVDKKQSTGRMLDEIVIRGHDNPSAKNFWQAEHWKSIVMNYKKTPFFHLYEEPLKVIYKEKKWDKLVDLCWAQFNLFRKWLNLADVKVVRMSEISSEGQKDELVLNHCNQFNADAVVFGSLGKDYVSVEKFTNHNIKVYFQDFKHPTYPQRYPGFEPYMSVLDLLMNTGPEAGEIMQTGNQSRSALERSAPWA